MITFKETLVKRDSDGALFVRYTPMFDAKCECCCSGVLTFATWDVAVGAPQAEHDAAMDEARANAVKVLRRISGADALAMDALRRIAKQNIIVHGSELIDVARNALVEIEG